jgi:hypothetical protein
LGLARFVFKFLDGLSFAYKRIILLFIIPLKNVSAKKNYISESSGRHGAREAKVTLLTTNPRSTTNILHPF